jgi:hypothetical protein
VRHTNVPDQLMPKQIRPMHQQADEYSATWRPLLGTMPLRVGRSVDTSGGICLSQSVNANSREMLCFSADEVVAQRQTIFSSQWVSISENRRCF